MKKIEPIKLKIKWDMDGPYNMQIRPGDVKIFEQEDDKYYYFGCGHGFWWAVDKNWVEPVEEGKAMDLEPHKKLHKATGCDGCKHENCGTGIDSLDICLDCEGYESYEPWLENAAMAVGRKWMDELVNEQQSGHDYPCGYGIDVIEEHNKTLSQSQYEYVDKPDHYKGDEVMKIIEKFELGFHLGNVVKYVLRCGKKPGENTLKDLEKARWYLNREIENIYKSKV